mmetsp:Transcript_7673/g.8773  ORF Transcript_7673/g.8773 Transcript_7673/m.8773 type:complete len:172 (+) Transcript_7673:169-684(+)
MQEESSSAAVTDAAPETATWTRFLPEWGGIRSNVQSSPFRWCVRESFMWGIATGTAMGVHRLRMKSRPFFAINVAFATSLLVTAPSYYFCYRKREHKEATIQMMMQANDFQHHDEMPEPVPVSDHPFLDNEDNKDGLQKEFSAKLKEKKEWQKRDETKDVADVFQEVKKSR